jgi:chromosome segregation ATPase
VEAKDKEIFNLKLQLHFLNEKLSSKVPEDIEITVKNNIDIKILNQTLQMDVKNWRKAARDLERELKNLQAHSDKTAKDLEDQLDDREKEIDDLRQRLLLRNNSASDDQHNALLDKYATLEEELDNAKLVLQETNEELERLRDALEAAQSHRSSTSGSRMDRRVEELERRNEELEVTVEDALEAVAERDQLIESLEDANATLKLGVEQLDHERQRAMQERSESRAEVIDEREERQALEEVCVYDLGTSHVTSPTFTYQGNGALRDRLAAMTIALDQKENDLEALTEELASYATQLDAHVQEVEDWKTEVQEERARAEELQDVSLSYSLPITLCRTLKPLPSL